MDTSTTPPIEVNSDMAEKNKFMDLYETVRKSPRDLHTELVKASRGLETDLQLRRVKTDLSNMVEWFIKGYGRGEAHFAKWASLDKNHTEWEKPRLRDFFDEDGVYLGPREDGVYPVFS